VNREPPAEVRQALAEEVGFGCPIPGCGSPYLTWHHFDPPWAVREHHDPEGMIALCRDHHPEADAGAFTDADLRGFKKAGREQTKIIGARFNWMRERLLIRLGGMFYYETPIALRIGDRPIVWFNRDGSDRILLNASMLTTSGESRLEMRDNFWITEGANIRTIACPPSGKLVSATYQNGDRLRIAFREVESIDALDRRYPIKVASSRQRSQRESLQPRDILSHASAAAMAGVQFPIAVAEISMRVTDGNLRFEPNKTTIGTNTFVGGWISHCQVGVQL